MQTIQEIDNQVKEHDEMYAAYPEPRSATAIINEARKQFLGDKKNALMFADKVRELERCIAEENEFINKRMKERAHEVNENILWFYDWSIDTAQRRRDSFQKAMKKFAWYERLCRGQTEMYTQDKINHAKAVPIGAVANLPDSHTKRQMEKCPLHQEKTASFCWFKDDNHWFCFGGCGGGDTIELYQRLHKCSFVDALNALQAF